jgi:Phycobilisome protein
MKPQLSDAIKELIQKARIVSFESWRSTYSSEAIQLFQAADYEGRYLSDQDLQQIQNLAPATANRMLIVKALRDQVIEIVNEARAQVLATFPEITAPGGGLYPADRAEACWRDFWHFLRCITYGIAGQSTQYTSSEGLHYMQQLYQELNVPLDAMIVGLEGIKVASLKRINPDEQASLTPYFDHLIDRLKQFQPAGS